ncbi:hypothetical protein, partial [Flavonifractor plautii]|uniref:hypothetical protein n=1 Tax=Flavonifractor plautii TaxID=292800 RepID=UPI00214C49ED
LNEKILIGKQGRQKRPTAGNGWPGEEAKALGTYHNRSVIEMLPGKTLTAVATIGQILTFQGRATLRADRERGCSRY